MESEPPSPTAITNASSHVYRLARRSGGAWRRGGAGDIQRYSVVLKMGRKPGDARLELGSNVGRLPLSTRITAALTCLK